MGAIIVPKAGQSIAQTVKQGMMEEQQARAMAATKEILSQKISHIINAVFQAIGADDADLALRVCLHHGVAIALATGTDKEAVLKGLDRVWAEEVEKLEKVRDEQRKMMVNALRGMVQNKAVVPPEFVANITAMGCKIPEDCQRYIDAQTPSAKVLEMVNEESQPEAKA